MGDFNAYTQEDPIEVLRDGGLHRPRRGARPGPLQLRLRRAVGVARPRARPRAALTAKVTDLAHWNINAVESFAYQYDGDPALYAPNPYRSSDHDPLVLGIDLEERCDGPAARRSSAPTAADDAPRHQRPDVIMGLGGNDLISGANGDDVVCGGAGDDVVDGGNGDDVLLGGFGDDTVYGGNGDDVLIGGPGADVLNGGSGSNSITQEGAES